MADPSLHAVTEDDGAVERRHLGVSARGLASGSRRPRPALPLAARIVLARLNRVRAGRLTVHLPGGEHRVVGGGGSPDAVMTVHRWRFFSRLLRGADVGAGESYVDGDWSTPDLVALTRLFLANEEVLAPPRLVGLLGRMRDRVLHLLRTNTRFQARRNIHAHYDLSNDFYGLFLDPSMTYSAALFSDPAQGLEAAQRAKYARLAEWAGLRPGDHVLEIGCGWGGFAEYAAGELGCRVTGITLSEEQARYARRRFEARGLGDRVEIRIVDYRDVEGRYDAVVSIEMLEAVGHRYLDDFFAACDRVLRPGGRVALQTITIPDRVYDRYRRGTDWIRKYIFPGGHLPSLGALQAAMARRTGFVIDRMENVGDHYATTLRHWRRRFWMKIDAVRALGFDERFVRLWDFYLASCEAAFLQRQIGNAQLQLSRIGDAVRGRQAPDAEAPDRGRP
jgi:cyclopropane-fatty-acyl-phospholipid synthase